MPESTSGYNPEKNDQHHEQPIDLNDKRLHVSMYFGTPFSKLLETSESQLAPLSSEDQQKVLAAVKAVTKFGKQDFSLIKGLVGRNPSNIFNIEADTDKRETAAAAFIRIYGFPWRLLGVNFKDYTPHVEFGEEKRNPSNFEKLYDAAFQQIGVGIMNVGSSFLRNYLAGQVDKSLYLLINSHLLTKDDASQVQSFFNKIKQIPVIYC